MHQDIITLMREAHINDVVGVIGVPRSGMIVASHLATMMGVPLTDFKSFASQSGFAHEGISRIKGRTPLKGNLLLVDDAVNEGTALFAAVKYISGGNSFTHNIAHPFEAYGFNIMPAALYTAGKYSSAIYVRNVPHTRIFGWNWLDSWLTQHTMFDLDGVLCEDPDIWDDDFTLYRDEIKSLRPRYIPKRPIHSVCTNRLEVFRPETQAWLAEYKVSYGQLIMRQEKTAAERRQAGPYGGWKAEQYKMSNAQLFAESSEQQASRVFRAAGRPVLCTDTDTMLSE